MKSILTFTTFFIFLLITLSEVKGQTPAKELKFDSLLKVNEYYLKQDQTKLRLLNAITFGYPKINPIKGIETGEQAITLAQKLSKQLLLAEAYNNKGLNHAAAGNFPEALDLYGKALTINQSQNNSYGIACNTLNISSIYQQKSETEEAKKFAEEALIIFEKINSKEGIARSYHTLGNCYINLSDYPKALAYYQKALSINSTLGNKSAMAKNLCNMGVVYNYLADYPQSLDYYTKALRIDEQLGNKSGIALNLGNIGLIYYHLSNYPKALEYYQKALIMREIMGDISGVANIYANTGLIYISLEDNTKALEYYQKALSIDEQQGDKIGVARHLGNIGNVYANLSQYSEALDYYQKALSLAEQLQNKTLVANHLTNIGSLYVNLTDNQSIKLGINASSKYLYGLKYLQKALILHEELDNRFGQAHTLDNIAIIYAFASDSVLFIAGVNPNDRYLKALACNRQSMEINTAIGDVNGQKGNWFSQSLIYEKQGNYAKAHDAYKNYIVLRDSVESGEIKDQIERKTMQYEFDKKETDFKFQQQLTEEQLLRSSQQAALSRQALLLSNKEKDLQRLAYLKEKAEKQQNLNLLSLSEKEKLLQAARLEEVNKEKRIQQSALELSQAEVKSKNLQRNGYIIGMVLCLLLGFFIFYNFINQKKANKKIEAGNVELVSINSELKATQNQLVQQEKLASLGSLTAGIAHEIKNPLNFVNNFAELSNELLDELKVAKTKEEKEEIILTLQQNLTKINQHGKRADGIVKGMLEHARTGTGEKQLTDINALCDEALNLAYHGMRANTANFNCSFEKYFDAHLPQIKIVRQDISRVILNCCNNALYAIKDTTDPKLAVSTHSSNGGLFIKIKDNGSGMSEKVKQKIFEPFFTTKPSGQGTGLGLSLSYDIIKAHGGKMEVQSEEGKGTEFLITLPI